MSNLLYMLERPLDERDFDRFGIKFMLERGHKVSIFDVGDVTLPTLEHDRSHYPDFKNVEIVCAQTRRDLDANLGLLRSADIIITFAGTSHFTLRNLPVHRLVSRSGTPYLFAFTNPYPGWTRYRDENGMKWARLRDVVSRISEIQPANSLMSRLPLQMLGVRRADYVVTGGRNCLAYGRLANGSTHQIMTHAMDYELFRREAEKARTETNTAVFIDEYLPYHPDLTNTGLKSPMKAEDYYGFLSALFDRIEEIFGLEVVIAACPRADYTDKPNAFGNRRIEYNATARLVGECRLVVAHRSTAINFAILFRKPVMLTTTEKIYQHSSQTPYLEGFARSLEQPIHFIDRLSSVNLDRVFEFDDAIYDRYIRDFIKQPDSPDAPFWQIVADSVNKDSSDLQF